MNANRLCFVQGQLSQVVWANLGVGEGDGCRGRVGLSCWICLAYPTVETWGVSQSELRITIISVHVLGWVWPRWTAQAPNCQWDPNNTKLC